MKIFMTLFHTTNVSWLYGAYSWFNSLSFAFFMNTIQKRSYRLSTRERTARYDIVPNSKMYNYTNLKG